MNQIAEKASIAVIWKAVQLTATKLIFLIRTMILAAILFPSDFGLISISLVALDFLISLTNLGLSQALIQKEISNEDTFDILWTIGVLRGILLTISLLLLSDFIAGLFGEPEVGDILKVLAIKPLIDELSSIKVAHLMKELNFKSLALIKISESVISSAIAVFLAPTLGVWALIYGILAGSLTYLIASYIFAPYRPGFNLSIKSVKPFISFGLWIFIISTIAVSANVIFQIIITRILGAAALGLYYLAYKLSFLAVEISSEVIGSVAFSLYSKLQFNSEKVSLAWSLIVRGLALVYLPTVVFLIGLSPFLIEFFLGVKWTGTEQLIQILATAGIFGTFGEAVVPLFKGLGKLLQIMIIEIIQYILLLSMVYILCTHFGIKGAALAWVFAGIGSFITCIIFLKRMNIKPFKGNIIFFMLIVVSSISGMMVSFLIVNHSPGIFIFILSLILGFGITIVLIWFFNSKFNLGIKDLLTQVFPKLKHIFK